MAALDDVTSAAPASATSSPQRPARKHVTVISAGSILGRSEDPEGEHVSTAGGSVDFTTSAGQVDWVTSQEFLRASFASSVLQCFGRSLWQADSFKYSFKSSSIDQYWSHSWAERSWKKLLLLLWLNNGTMAVIFSTFTALGVIPLYTLGFLPSLSGLAASAASAEVSIWCVAAGLLGLLLGMLLWRPGKMVFIDKVCLNEVPEVPEVPEGDGQLKQEGMRNIGACLKHSKSMLVLWDPSHAQQLQAIFELATFLKCHEGEKVHLDIRPTMLAPFLLVNLAGNVLIAVAQILVPFDHNWSIFLVAACFAPYFLACGCLLRSYFASIQGLKDQLGFFSIDDTVCLQCDRKILLECIHVWFGSIEDFERYVCIKVARVFSQRLGNFLCQYWMVIILSAPIFWAHLDMIAKAVVSEDYGTASLLAVTAFTWWLGILPAAYVLFIALMAKSQRRQLRRTSNALKLCWRAVPPCALVLLLLVAGMYQTFCIRYMNDAFLGICIFAGTMIIPCYLVWRASTKNTSMFTPRTNACDPVDRA